MSGFFKGRRVPPVGSLWVTTRETTTRRWCVCHDTRSIQPKPPGSRLLVVAAHDREALSLVRPGFSCVLVTCDGELAWVYTAWGEGAVRL